MIQPYSTLPEHFDVAVSFAGPEREYAETLATIVREAGYAVFYDNFYEEHLWGKDLFVFLAPFKYLLTVRTKPRVVV